MKHRYAFALVGAILLAACSTAESLPFVDCAATLPGCEQASDCGTLTLTLGVCGVLACDVDGLIGAPSIPGVPHGCYVGVSPTCEVHPDGGVP